LFPVLTALQRAHCDSTITKAGKGLRLEIGTIILSVSLRVSRRLFIEF